MNSNPGAGMQVMLSARLTACCSFPASSLSLLQTPFFSENVSAVFNFLAASIGGLSKFFRLDSQQ
jgi:hypothetical protein